MENSTSEFYFCLASFTFPFSVGILHLSDLLLGTFILLTGKKTISSLSFSSTPMKTNFDLEMSAVKALDDQYLLQDRHCVTYPHVSSSRLGRVFTATNSLLWPHVSPGGCLSFNTSSSHLIVDQDFCSHPAQASMVLDSALLYSAFFLLLLYIFFLISFSLMLQKHMIPASVSIVRVEQPFGSVWHRWKKTKSLLWPALNQTFLF